MATTPLVEAKGLGISYTRGSRRDDLQAVAYRVLSGNRRTSPFWALRDVTFTAGAGQILGVIGRNGAGKSTLCRALAGLVRPDAGSLSVRGEVSTLLSLGTGFNNDLSGRENILLNGLMLGFSRRRVDGLAEEIVRFSGLERFIDQPLKFYSSGMRSRLGFSIAAMLEPEVLVIDEALGVGDIEFTERAGERLRSLMRSARLVLLVSHQLDVITRYCTHALWLDGGRVRACGAPAEVVAEYDESMPAARKARIVSVPGVPKAATEERAIAVDSVGVRFSLARARRPRTSESGPGQTARQIWALEDVTFAVNVGEVIGVIGANGAGKSTLCRVLAGVLRPDKGEARVARRVTALLTLGTGLNHQLSGRDNVYLRGMLLGLSRRRVRALFDEIVAFAELEAFIDEPVKHYSRGMRARLAFSTATAVDPEVLVIDEALTVGDAAFAVKAAARIETLIGRAAAVFVVTHNLTFVRSACTRALWLERGRLAFDGAPHEAVRRYRLASGQPAEPPETPVRSAAARATS